MNRSSKEMGSIETEDRRFRELFGVGPLVALAAFSLLCELGLLPDGGTLKHLMWTLCFLKVYPTEQVLCSLCGGIDPKTARKWVWLFIAALSELELELIVWERRKEGDRGADCLVSVDGTDFWIAQHGATFSSHKFAKKSGLRCECAICIQTGVVVWIHGPFACGAFPDITIFRDSTLSFLDTAEQVEADDGYVGESPRHVKCPKRFTNPPEAEAMQNRVRSRQETVNKRFKQWGLLKQTCRHLLLDHGDVFRACASLSQLSINWGEPLFSCGYKDLPFNNPCEVEEEDDEL